MRPVRTGIDRSGPQVLLSLNADHGRLRVNWNLNKRGAAALGAILLAAGAADEDCEHECIFDSELHIAKDQPQ
jgi:hypothetical protein